MFLAVAHARITSLTKHESLHPVTAQMLVTTRWIPTGPDSHVLVSDQR